MALFALMLLALLWLLAVPFRIVRISVAGVLETARALVMLLARVLGGQPRGTRGRRG